MEEWFRHRKRYASLSHSEVIRDSIIMVSSYIHLNAVQKGNLIVFPHPPLPPRETVSQYHLPNRHAQYVVGAQFIEPYRWA